jgi:hypothetical protein
LQDRRISNTPSAEKQGDHRWLSYTATSSNRQRSFTGRSLLLRRHGVIVVSDIDDTIKDSDVPETHELIVNTLFRPFRHTPGMPEIYNTWAANHAENIVPAPRNSRLKTHNSQLLECLPRTDSFPVPIPSCVPRPETGFSTVDLPHLEEAAVIFCKRHRNRFEVFAIRNHAAIEIFRGNAGLTEESRHHRGRPALGAYHDYISWTLWKLVHGGSFVFDKVEIGNVCGFDMPAAFDFPLLIFFVVSDVD